MFGRWMMIPSGAAILAFAAVTAASPQSFSCSSGQPSCLGFGDKVVDRNAQCFDSYTCFPSGFVCKKDMDELADRAKRMASNYDDLRLCLSRSTDMDDVARCVSIDSMRF